MKIIFVEPNLKNYNGHPFPLLNGLYKFTGNERNEIQFGYVSHIDVSGEIISDFKGNLFPVCDSNCFESKDIGIRVEYIKKIIKHFDLTSDDLIFFVTIHLYEIEAIKEILSTYENAPKIFGELHQLNRPERNSDEIITNKKRQETIQEYQKVFKNLDLNKFKLFCTNVSELSKLLLKITKTKIARLPIVFQPYNLKLENRDKQTTISFIGDGRKEKGLLKFLIFANRFADKLSDTKINIQLCNIRYFNEEELKLVLDIKTSLSKSKNINFIENINTEKEFSQLVLSSDFIILPYDPKHYSIRLSAIAIECSVVGVPIIASEKTSFGNDVKNGKMSGILFKYSDSDSLFCNNLYKALKTALANKQKYKIKARKLMKQNIEFNSPKSFIIKILKHVRR